MSWFSNPFATSFRSSEVQPNNSDGDEEDEHTHSKGVKEDLSELTKTFSRQLWGVASFLAPPPQAKHHNSSSDDGDDEASMASHATLQNESSHDGHYEASMAPRRRHSHIASSLAPPSIDDGDDEASLSHHSHPKQGGHGLITDEGAASIADDAEEEPSLHHSHFEQGNRRLLTEEMELSEELVDVDFEGVMDETLVGPAETSNSQALNGIERVKNPQSSPHLLHHQSLDLLGQNAAQSFTGISRDLAELKGSVASGFSRILRVVREEVGQEETSKSHKDDSDEDEEIADDPAGSTHARKLQGINMLFRPLFSNILHDDGGKKRVDASSDDDVEEEAYEDGPREGYDGQTSSHPRAFKLQDTFIDSFKSISEFASSLISVSLNSDDEEEAWERERNSQVVGITEEVLTFARNISMHPETWLDFSLFAYANENDEFDMSAAQKEHVHALELAIPSLAALRTELCPDCMNEGTFWKIYFVLLHSRLHKVDAAILSTPKIMEVRARLLQKLQEGEVEKVKNERKEFSTSKGKDAMGMTSSLQTASEVQADDFGQVEVKENDSAEGVQNKRVLVNTVKLAASNYKGEEKDADRWLQEEPLPHVHSTLGSRNEEDVSFSDLEEDDEPTSKTVERSDSTQSFGWVQLSKNQSEEDFEGLRASEKAELRGFRRGDVGASREQLSHSSAQTSRKQDQSESSDWSTVEEDDAASSDFM